LGKARNSDFEPSAARLLVKLGTAYEQTGEAAKGRKYYEDALALYEKLRDNSQHILVLSRLGGLCRREGDLEAARDYYRRALDLAMLRHGETHTEVANAANNLGVVYTEMHEAAKAEGYHMRALAIREKCFGAVHPDVALSMANLAAAYHTMGDFARARAFYEGALNTYERFLPADDPGLKTVRSNYASLLESVEKPA
jgi:tetratricopeptide (TPR) repeat protein